MLFYRLSIENIDLSVRSRTTYFLGDTLVFLNKVKTNLYDISEKISSFPVNLQNSFQFISNFLYCAHCMCRPLAQHWT